MLRSCLLLHLISLASAASFYVSLTGSDANAGTTPALPFKTIAACAAAMSKEQSDSECSVEAGVYRESVTLKHSNNNPHRQMFRSVPGNGTSKAIISGLEEIHGLWTRRRKTERHRTTLPPPPPSCIWQIPMTDAPVDGGRIDQLFVQGGMVHEARWPNAGDAGFDADAQMLLSTEYWSLTKNGTVYGNIVDGDLADASSEFSWNGAQATLNVGEQFYTYTRTVTDHAVGGNSFNYSKDLGFPDLNWLKYAGQQYFLSGKLEALDSPGEWFHDSSASILYLWPPSSSGGTAAASSCGNNDADPNALNVEWKARDYAFTMLPNQGNLQEVAVSGFTFIGATISLQKCNDCTFTDLVFEYPTYNSTIPEANPPATRGNAAGTTFSGTNLTVEKVSLRYSPNSGLYISGNNVVAKDILVEYTDWLGTLVYAPLKVSGLNVSLSQSTVSWFGNAGVVTSVPNANPTSTQPQRPGVPAPVPIPMSDYRRLAVSHCHIHHGARIGLDASALYAGGWATAGLEWHHNWIHDTREKCIRLDDQSRNATVHHNVLWNCAMPLDDQRHGGNGIVTKGDGHLVYANTIFQTEESSLCIPSCAEPLKAFRTQYPLSPEQNKHSNLFNMAITNGDLGHPCSCSNASTPEGGNQSAILNTSNLMLQDVANFDFRPTKESPLVDAGIVWAPFTDGYTGKAPDIGAYELDGDPWVAGCQHDPACSTHVFDA